MELLLDYGKDWELTTSVIFILGILVSFCICTFFLEVWAKHRASIAFFIAALVLVKALFLLSFPFRGEHSASWESGFSCGSNVVVVMVAAIMIAGSPTPYELRNQSSNTVPPPLQVPPSKNLPPDRPDKDS